jgi:hypothetical protein
VTFLSIIFHKPSLENHFYFYFPNMIVCVTIQFVTLSNLNVPAINLLFHHVANDL